jgi:hypothetical protein
MIKGNMAAGKCTYFAEKKLSVVGSRGAFALPSAPARGP